MEPGIYRKQIVLIELHDDRLPFLLLSEISGFFQKHTTPASVATESLWYFTEVLETTVQVDLPVRGERLQTF